MNKTTVVNIHHKKPYDILCTRPGPYGNPFRIGRDGTREEVIEKFRRYLSRRPDLVAQIKRECKGFVLGCVCKPLPCHCDVIAEIADAED